LHAAGPAVAALRGRPYRGDMVRLSLVIVGVVIAIVLAFTVIGFVIGFVLKALFIGLLILGVFALFGMFRAGRRSARGSRE
jgi:hypothetical protein